MSHTHEDVDVAQSCARCAVLIANGDDSAFDLDKSPHDRQALADALDVIDASAHVVVDGVEEDCYLFRCHFCHQRVIEQPVRVICES